MVVVSVAMDKTVTVRAEENVITSVFPNALWPMGDVLRADFVDDANGWLLYSAGKCAEFKSQCSQQSELLSTTDGGRTFRVMTPRVAALAMPGKSSVELPLVNSGVFNVGPQTIRGASTSTQTGTLSGTQISQGEGFDCTS